MAIIHYIKGDATKPTIAGNKIITHICNDIGAWGAGFVLAISKRWKMPEIKYKEWAKSKDKFVLGNVQYVQVEKDILIANMIGQKGIKNINNIAPIRYDAVKICLLKVSKVAKENNATIHMPRIGCGLAGGDWNEIEKIITETLIEKDIDVYVYDIR